MRSESSVISAFEKEPVEDVIVPGWAEFEAHEPWSSVQPVMSDVFFQLTGRFVRCRWDSSEILLQFSVVDSLAFDHPIFQEDEVRPFAISMAGLWVRPANARGFVSELDLIIAGGRPDDECAVKAAGIRISGASYLFLDPVSFDGIELRTEEQGRSWYDEFSEREPELRRVRWVRRGDRLERIAGPSR